ncbi:MAG: acyltransferase [Coprococcus sp.]
MKERTFDKDASNAIKGIAILMMLMHHCFMNEGRFFGYDISFSPFGQNHIVALASFFKICVSLFAIISGYGLYLNYESKSEKLSPTRWVISREIRTLAGFWFIFIISAVLCQIIDGRTMEIYCADGRLNGIMYMLAEFFGVSDLLKLPEMNGTWWYMSAAVVFVLLIPFLKKLDEYLILVLAMVIVIPRFCIMGSTTIGMTGVMSFIPAFLLGVIAAKYNLINRWMKLWKKGAARFIKPIVEIVVLLLCYMLYNRVPHTRFIEFKWAVVPFAVLLFSVEFIAFIPVVKQILQFLGKHSMNIFLTHTFIRQYYLRDFTYSFKHFLLIILVLTIISLAISFVIELLKKLTRYNALIEKIRRYAEQS